MHLIHTTSDKVLMKGKKEKGGQRDREKDRKEGRKDVEKEGWQHYKAIKE